MLSKRNEIWSTVVADGPVGAVAGDGPFGPFSFVENLPTQIKFATPNNPAQRRARGKIRIKLDNF